MTTLLYEDYYEHVLNDDCHPLIEEREINNDASLPSVIEFQGHLFNTLFHNSIEWPIGYIKFFRSDNSKELLFHSGNGQYEIVYVDNTNRKNLLTG